MLDMSQSLDKLEIVLLQAASLYLQCDHAALEEKLCALQRILSEDEVVPGERAERAYRLDALVAREILGTDATSWLCPLLMRPSLADAAEALIEELALAKKTEVMRVSFLNTEPLHISVANSTKPDWSMAGGRRIWQDSLSLLKLLLDGEIDVRSRRVVEFGCGLGVVGLTCARLGARHVLLTDYDRDLLDACQRSAELNDLEHIVSTSHLDWVDVVNGKVSRDNFGIFDVAVAADIVYETHHASLVLGVVDWILREAVVAEVAIVAQPPSAREGIEELDTLLKVDRNKFACHGNAHGVAGRDDSLQWTLRALPEVEPGCSARLYRFASTSVCVEVGRALQLRMRNHSRLHSEGH